MRPLLALLPLVLAAPLCAQDAPSPRAHARPTWGEAFVAAGGTAVLGFAGGTVGALIGGSTATCRPGTWFCGLEEAVVGGVIGGSAGVVGGAVLARRHHRRGSTVGLAMGTALGLAAGTSALEALHRNDCTTSAPSTVCEGRPTALGNVLLVALPLAGGAAGYRYGPGARGPGRAPRVAVQPVATPSGAGVHARVVF